MHLFCLIWDILTLGESRIWFILGSRYSRNSLVKIAYGIVVFWSRLWLKAAFTSWARSFSHNAQTLVDLNRALVASKINKALHNLCTVQDSNGVSVHNIWYNVLAIIPPQFSGTCSDPPDSTKTSSVLVEGPHASLGRRFSARWAPAN